MSGDVMERALVNRIAALEDGLRNIEGMAQQFDADPDFRSIEQIASTLLSSGTVEAFRQALVEIATWEGTKPGEIAKAVLRSESLVSPPPETKREDDPRFDDGAEA